MIRLFKPFMPGDVDQPLLEVLHSGYIAQGPQVEKFEKILTDYFGNNVVTTNSGTSAIHLALRCADVQPGDEVITTPMTCIATNVPILALGATPVWADVDRTTGLIDPADVEAKITDRTKAIISVDWGGAPVKYNLLRKIADRHNLKFISDAAHSLGSTYKGRKVGSRGMAHFTCFSLQAIKTITTIDGGILVCDDAADAERARRLRWFGVPRDNSVKFRGELDVEEWGYKYNMNDVNAVVGIVQMKYLDDAVKRQSANARLFFFGLDPYKYQHAQPLYEHVSSTWIYTVLVTPQKREDFRQYMESQDIEVSQVHWRNDTHTAFKDFKTDLPNLDKFSSRMICVPSHHQLSKWELMHIIEVMNNWTA